MTEKGEGYVDPTVSRGDAERDAMLEPPSAVEKQALEAMTRRLQDALGQRPPFDSMEGIAEAFSYHPPQGEQVLAYSQIRQEALHVAISTLVLCPASAERTLALRALQQFVMWANAAIAIYGNRGEPQEPKVEAPSRPVSQEIPLVRDEEPPPYP